MKISACIDMMFSRFDFYDRFAAVKNCGINTVEFWKWSNKDIAAVLDKLNEFNMNLSVFNIDCADEKLSGELSRGILNSGRSDDFISAIHESIPIYKTLNANAMIVLIGETIENISRGQQLENILKCLDKAKPIVEKNDVTLVLEPLNAVDRKNYFLPEAAPLFDILNKVDSPNIKMLYDIYHQNVTGDFSIDEIKKNINRIGHFHVADCPGRHQPGSGRVDYPYIMSEIEKSGYDGYIGLEYRATENDENTLGFVEEAYRRV